MEKQLKSSPENAKRHCSLCKTKVCVGGFYQCIGCKCYNCNGCISRTKARGNLYEMEAKSNHGYYAERSIPDVTRKKRPMIRAFLCMECENKCNYSLNKLV